MKEWKITFNWVSYQTGTAIIKAKTRKAAEKKADEMCAGDIDDWNQVDGNLSVDHIDEVVT